MKKTTNEHDITKAMLETIRLSEIANIKSLNEQMEDIIDLSGEELARQQTEFSERVSPRVQFGPFKIYPNAKNVAFSGKFNDGIEWQFSLLDGLYMNMPNIEVNDEIVELTKKLNAHFVNWEDEWGKKINTEYSGNNGEI